LRADLSVIRSGLFVPGNVWQRLEKALASAADAVIVDLEDGVPAAEKVAARATVASLVPGAERPWVVLRVNGVGTPEHEDDLELATQLEVDAIMLPKASAASIDSLPAGVPPVWALIETAAGIRDVDAVAAAQAVEVLALGTVDLALDLGLEETAGQDEFLLPRAALAVASRAAGLRSPFDGVCVAVRDEELLRTEAARARSLGMGGKLCIHPAQLGPVREAFAPTTAAVERAREIVSAFEMAEASGEGAISLDGELVDKPVVDKARAILRAAEEE
jgi:citrate lyase subunit beta / citryl-CoA lyase